MTSFTACHSFARMANTVTLRVGELRKALEGLPDETLVVATYDNGIPADVASVRVTDTDRYHPGQRVLVIEVDS